MPKLYIQAGMVKVLYKELPDDQFAHLPVIKIPIIEKVSYSPEWKELASTATRKEVEFVRQQDGTYQASVFV